MTLRYERFADTSGRGSILRKKDLTEIKAKAAEHFFAKKFDSRVDSCILDLIDREILKVTNL
jgi:alpha/beta superfamily hydrolase